MAPSTLTAPSTTTNIEIKSAAVAGQGVFATGPLGIGDGVVRVVRPLLVALDTERLLDTCYECFGREGDGGIEGVEGVLGFGGGDGDGKEEGGLRVCTGCRGVRYCSKACQKASWFAHHSLECPIFKQVYPRVMPSHLRAVLRLLLLKKAGRVKEEDWDSLLTCSTHVKEYNQPDQREQLSSLMQMAKMLDVWTQGGFRDEFMLELLMRLKINSLTLQTPFHDPLGLALHPVLAKVNHSCDPNCYVRFPGPQSSLKGTSSSNSSTIVLTPLRQISTDEEISISYVDETMPVRYRRQELKDRYFFTCNCTKCKREEESESQLEHTALMAIHNLQDQAKKILDNTDSSDTGTSSSPAARIKSVTSHLQNIFTHNSNWPTTLYPFAQLLHQLILSHIDTQNFVAAFSLAALLHLHVDPVLYSSPTHPLLLTHTFLLVKLTGAVLNVAQSSEMNLDNDPRVLKLVRNLDLDLWHRALSEKMVLMASKTWKEEAWVRMRGILERQQNSNSRTRVPAKEQERMELLCTYVLDTLKKKHN